MVKKKFYVTTPVYYSNAKPHIGGAYTTIAADVLARWHKSLGEGVFFSTGTDEHGKKIQETAKQEGRDVKEFVDEIAVLYKELFEKLNCEYNVFVRTTDDYHVKEVENVLSTLYKKGLIYKGTYEAPYCVGCEQYLREVDLVDGKCPLHNREPELKKEECYLFKLASFQEDLIKAIESKKFEILPKKRENEVLSFIKSGLRDVAFSRDKKDVSWGIELPFDKEHTCFVWVDAFWNYISGLKKDMKFWPANLQLMANDIIRVHATIWPAIVLAMGLELPKRLFVHGYFTLNGKKMSKSLGNTVDPLDLIEKYPVDSLRYFLMRNISFGEDGDFSEKSLIDRHNNELANKLGNLISRVAGLIEKNGMEKCENSLKKKLDLKKIEKLFENYELDKVLNEIFGFIDSCNEYVQNKKPWETKDKKVLYELADSIKMISILLWSFMPSSCEKIAENFGFKVGEDLFKDIEKNLEVSEIKKCDILFRKIE
jgi:methionyl-tRNA synthetase